MILELNRRIVFRRHRDRTILYDPDSRRVLTVNPAGAAVYSRLLAHRDFDALTAEFAGDDPVKIRQVENFLAMLQGAGFLVGFHRGDLVPFPPREEAAPEGSDRCGIGVSMLGTFAGGDELETVPADPNRLRRGDVVAFTDAAGRRTGHRIVGGVPGAWITMGDNNDRPDPGTLDPARSSVMLITGLRRDGRRVRIAGGVPGMWHFYRLRLRRQLKAALRTVLVPLLDKAGFWRQSPDHAAVFGDTIQYSRRGRLIGWRVRGIPIYRRQYLRLRYRLPER